MSDTRPKKGAKRATVKIKRKESDVVIHVFAQFRNTIVTVTDVRGNTLSWATAGQNHKGSKKRTPFAGADAMKRACETAVMKYGIENAEVRVRGAGSQRDKVIQAAADFVRISSIVDCTGIPHNGCRAAGERRV